MEQLNQVLLEGFIAEKEETVQVDGGTIIMFTLRHIKQYKNSDDKKKEALYNFRVVAEGRLANVIYKKRLGTKLRLVGTLEATPDEKLIIRAIHIEFKPDLTQNNLK